MKELIQAVRDFFATSPSEGDMEGFFKALEEEKRNKGLSKMIKSDGREVYDRLRRAVELDSAVALTVRTEDLKAILDEYCFISSEARVLVLKVHEDHADAERYRYLKKHSGEVDYDGGYTQFYVFPRLNRDLDDKSLPIDRRYFTDIDACVDHHRNKPS